MSIVSKAMGTRLHSLLRSHPSLPSPLLRAQLCGVSFYPHASCPAALGPTLKRPLRQGNVPSHPSKEELTITL